ncbi:hypothetical protein ZWY2020_044273 [Hordeum vulgare]|nr:hypothetical protein ZWY2020_044273 [Hordeum vulgare]
MAESAVKAVVGNVSNLAVQETTLLCGVTLEVECLKNELERLKWYLKSADAKWKSGDERVATWVCQIRAVSYEAENVIEVADYMGKRNSLKKGFLGAISRYARLPGDLITLHKVGVEIKRVRRKLDEIFQSAERLKFNLDTSVVDKVHTDGESEQAYGLMYENIEDDSVMVGFEDEYEEIVDKLVDTEKNLSAVSIVAMGGAGKTTLARKVYTSSVVEQHFETIAWVTVSQKYKGIDLMKDIMKQIMGKRDDSLEQMQEYEKKQDKMGFLMSSTKLQDKMNQLRTFSWEISRIPSELINIFGNMPHLVDIYLNKFNVLKRIPREFPQSVRRLVLFADIIEQDPMPIFEKLPSLVVLELSGYHGRIMSCSAKGFPRMQSLKLDEFSIEEWRMEVGSMPRLSHLTLRRCRKIEKLPEGLLHLRFLVGDIELFNVPQINEDDNTLYELQRRGWKVKRSP